MRPLSQPSHASRLLAALLFFPALALAALTPSRLRCEYLENPVGLDAIAPRLNWIVSSETRGERQTAYEILVASTAAALNSDRGDVWSSGKVESAETGPIEYTGAQLNSYQHVWWKVRVWDRAGQPSAWSAPAEWEMAVLDSGTWSGDWIARNTATAVQPLPLLRRSFTLGGAVARARVYVAGLGYHELYLNGHRIGDHIRDAGFTDYSKRILYSTYDVTTDLQKGVNAVGLMLGNGWYNVQTLAGPHFETAPWRASPRARLMLRVEFTDGRVQTIVTDRQWKTAAGPLLYDSLYGGEIYDARLEQAGWDTGRFDDRAWTPAQIVESPGGRMVAQAMPPVTVDRALTPIRMTEPQPGIYVFDTGQNLAGVAEISLAGPAGTSVELKYAECLADNGLVDQTNLTIAPARREPGQRFQTDTFILKGQGTETWHSRFAFYGFRYIQVTGAPGQLSPKNLRVLFTHSAVPEVGKLETSNPVVNKIWEAARWSYLSNIQGIFSACPQREKNGWAGDTAIACEQGLLTYDGITLYEKWLRDLSDAQRDTGMLPVVAPPSETAWRWGVCPAWESVFLTVPKFLQVYYGDSRALRQLYAAQVRYLNDLTAKSHNGTIEANGLGDWAQWKTSTPVQLTSTSYYYLCARTLAESAHLLGLQDDEQKWTTLAANIRQAFNEKFYKASTGLYANGSQTALSCALYQDLAEPDQRPRVLQNLVAAIHANNDHIDTGILGAMYLLPVLSDHGETELAYRLVTQKTIPSWGYWIEQGATTLWESWMGSHGNDGSLNHIMFGDVSAWFTRTLAGLNPDPAAPGFSHFFIAPHPVEDLSWVNETYDSVRGPIRVAWRKQHGRFELDATVPANTTATITLPAFAAEHIREGQQPLASAPGVKLDHASNGVAVIHVESGTYHFSVAH